MWNLWAPSKASERNFYGESLGALQGAQREFLRGIFGRLAKRPDGISTGNLWAPCKAPKSNFYRESLGALQGAPKEILRGIFGRFARRPKELSIRRIFAYGRLARHLKGNYTGIFGRLASRPKRISTRSEIESAWQSSLFRDRPCYSLVCLLGPVELLFPVQAYVCKPHQ